MKEKNEFTVSLPLFEGFYNTIFDVDWEEYEKEVEGFIQKSEFTDTPTSYGDYLFDNDSYEFHVATLFVEAFKKYSPSYVSNIEVLRIIHPRDYTYRNDEIEVKITLSDDFREKMMNFMSSNEKWLRSKIQEDWTDKPGFWSFLSNNYDKWIEYIKQPKISQIAANHFSEIIGYNMLADNEDICNCITEEVLENINMVQFIKCTIYGKQ